MPTSPPSEVLANGRWHEPNDPFAMGISVDTRAGFRKVTIDDEDPNAIAGFPERNQAPIASISDDGLKIVTGPFDLPVQHIHGATAEIDLAPTLGVRGGAGFTTFGPDGTILVQVAPGAFEGPTDYIKIIP